MGAQDAFGAGTPQGAGYDLGAVEYRSVIPDPAAPRLLGLSRQRDGSTRVEFAGLAGGSYLIEKSVDLRVWNIAGNADEHSPGRFSFIDRGGAPARFYRAVAR